MKQNHEIRIKICKDELDSIQKKAKACGLSVSAYMRMVCLKSQVSIE
jgi:predicted DNA binding CopG/RHH family protein